MLHWPSITYKKEAATGGFQQKTVFLKIWQYSQTPTQAFSSEYCEIFKSTYFGKHLRMAAPDDRNILCENI